MDRETWRATVHGVKKSWTRLSNWTELNWTDGGQYMLLFALTVLYLSKRERLCKVLSGSFCLSFPKTIFPEGGISGALGVVTDLYLVLCA